MRPPARIYSCKVMHHRLKPVAHRFVYRVFTLLLDLDALPELARGNRFFSVDRFNLVSFHKVDHGPRDGTALRPWVERQLSDAGIAVEDPRIEISCFPRLLGVVFNPLSVYWCFDRANGRLVAIVYEVKNTFGGQHCYVLPGGGARDGALVRHSAAKDFFVSPFIDASMTYHFKVRVPDERFSVLINETDRDGTLLVATQTGTQRPFSQTSLVRVVAGNFFMTFKVIAGIHWEALRLWIKGVPLYLHQRRKMPAEQAQP